MKQNTKRFISLALGAIFLVSALVVYVKYTRDASLEVRRLRGLVKTREEFVAKQAAVITKVDQLISQYTKEQGDEEDVISKALPRGPELGNALAQVVGIFEANGLEVSSVNFSVEGAKNIQGAGQPGRATSTKSLVRANGRVSIQTETRGTYVQLKSVLSMFETNIRVIEVDSVDFSPREGENEFDFSINLVTYYQT